ncbi:MAG: nitroreductase [Lautropia sp.]
MNLLRAEPAGPARSKLPRLSDAQRTAFDVLLSRRSRWPLGDPAPTDAEIGMVIDLALRAPDHGQLQPWRFVLVRGDARAALGDVFVRAARARDPDSDGERFRAKALAAPLIIAMAAHLQSGHKVPEIEQLLAVGAGAMNMLNALHILGYGGFWSTGANSRDDTVRQALGFEAADRLVGFLYVGTPKDGERAAPRPSRARFVREWRPAHALVAR